MTVVNPKSISGINSITMASGSDNLLTIHTTNTTERVRVNSDGDVIVGSGITVSPDGDIFATGVTTSTTFSGNFSGGTVSGTTGTFTGDVDIADKIVHTGDTDTAIRFSGADTITAETGGTERIRIQSDGRIAINDTGNTNYTTFSPCLVIGDSGDSTPGLVLRGSTSSNCDISFCDNSGAESDDGVSEGLIRYEHSNDAMIFHTADGERVRIDSSGNFGIGTESPDRKLDVSGTGNVYGKFQSTSATGAGIEVKDSGQDWLIQADNGGSQQSLAFYDLANTSYRVHMKSNGNVEIVNGNLVIGTAGKGIDFSAAADDSTNLAETVDSSVLDDYEEGQFTPAVQFDSGGGGISYGTRYGRYRKIGNMVSITYYMEISSGVSSSDYFARLSLPFNGFGGSVGHQDARIRQWNTGYSDWFVSLGGSAPVFFHSNANGSSSNYARGDDINGYKLSGQVILYT